MAGNSRFSTSLFVAFLLIALAVSILYFSTDVLNSLEAYYYENYFPLDLVFDEGIDLKQYDGSVILNCLHDKNFCPEGVHHKDDVTGEIFPSNPDQPKTAQPYVPPEDPNAPPDPTTIPEPVQNLVNDADMKIYIIFVLLVIGIGVLAFYFLRKHRKR